MGTAKAYNNEMKSRYNTIRKCKEDNTLRKVAVIKPLKSNPVSIYFPPDMLPDRTFALWNNAYERYFGVDEVRFENDTLKLYENLSKK